MEEQKLYEQYHCLLYTAKGVKQTQCLFFFIFTPENRLAGSKQKGELWREIDYAVKMDYRYNESDR